jgi:hypothetical protein
MATNISSSQANIFVTGSFIKDNVNINFAGSDECGYKYSWHSNVDSSKTQTKDPFVCVFIIDLSGSMKSSGSALPAVNACKSACIKVLEHGAGDVYVIFFAGATLIRKVNANNYNAEIDGIVGNYFSGSFNTHHPLNPNTTQPNIAFNKFYELITNNYTEKQLFRIIFMTDGEFNGMNNAPIYYKNEWNKISISFSSTNYKFMIDTIGYKNDYIQNMKDMGEEFTKFGNEFSYKTISKPSEIESSIMALIESYKIGKIPSINLENHTLKQYDTIYSSNKLFLENNVYEFSENEQNKQNEQKGITNEWLIKVIKMEIDIGLREQSISNKIKEILSSSNIMESKDKLNNIFNNNLTYTSTLHQSVMSLKNDVKSLKSRNVSQWSDLQERLRNYFDQYNELQKLIASELGEKKAFEISTQINSHISDRHLRTLQRRRANNAKATNNKKVNIQIISDDPLTISNYDNTIVLNSLSSALDDYYSCMYSQDKWSDSLETVFGIPTKYIWKENDDYNPACASISFVSASNFISVEGYIDAQDFFCGIDPDHKNAYSNSQYVKSGHDETNGFIPIATDPFFLDKINFVKERLGLMVAGSNLSFANRHFHLYVAVIRQCIEQLVNDPTEKLLQITLLLMNTFRIITDKYKCIFEKDQSPLSKPTILYNIAIGNTAPYLFVSPWESAMYVVISSTIHLESALEIYNTKQEYHIENIAEFKALLWKMIFRHFMLFMIKLDIANNWSNPKLWNLESSSNIENIILSEGKEAIKKYLMTEEKYLNITSLPIEIINDIQLIKENKYVKMFDLFCKLSVQINDDTWTTITSTWLPPTDLNITLNGNFSYYNMENFNDDFYWTTWEASYRGRPKDCHPLTEKNKIVTYIVRKINDNYGSTLTSILKDVQEYQEFTKKEYETRFLPVTFTKEQENEINELFDNIYNKEISIGDFKESMYKILGQKYTQQFYEVLHHDNIDVLLNLYNYCSKRKHAITIKSTKLPYSCPAQISSPIFLQQLSELEFVQYYKPLGFGYSTKKYKMWISDYHSFMVQLLNLHNENDFVDIVLRHILSQNNSNPIIGKSFDKFKDDITTFYQRFNNYTNKSVFQKVHDSLKH